MSTTRAEPRPTTGVVELREDVPLKSLGSGAAGGWGAPRGVLACFGALTAGITVALLAQLYAGAGGAGSTHGSVAAGGGAQCSRAGTNALRVGGGALDAAASAALCLAVTTPTRTSLDASGIMVVWEYRSSRDKPPVLVSWGAAPDAGAANWTEAGARPWAPHREPRLVCALAALHAGRGRSAGVPPARLPWRRWLQPALNTAMSLDTVPEPVDASVLAAPPPPSPPPQLAAYLRLLQNYSSSEVSSWCGADGVRLGAAQGGHVGRWRVWGAAGGAEALLRALRAQETPSDADLDPLDTAIYKAAFSLTADDTVAGVGKADIASGGEAGGGVGGGAASGVAVVDSTDTYLALVTGISGVGSAIKVGPEWLVQGWTRDEPTAPLDLAPALLVEDAVCGTRYVLGAESRAALAQTGAALAGGAALLPAVERPRLAATPGGLAGEARGAALPAPLAALAAHRTAPTPAAVNVVQQRGDELASHADSRSGGLASRF